MAIFYLELLDFGSCLTWPRVAVACPTASAKSIRGDGLRDGGRRGQGRDREIERPV